MAEPNMTAAGHGAQERRRDAMNAALTASIEGERLDLVARRLDRRAPPSWKGSSTSPQATMPVRARSTSISAGWSASTPSAPG